MKIFGYQRLVLGYHGCEREVRDKILSGFDTMRSSSNDYDWLGRGVYFWEYGEERAIQWAENQRSRGKIKEPSVIGALLHLGNCFDLLDVKHTQLLGEAYSLFKETLEKSGKKLPQNLPASPHDSDILLRKCDCALINWTLEQLEEGDSKQKFHSVRGVFQEGEFAFPESLIRQKSHIQIAVRDPACILGYFLPR